MHTIYFTPRAPVRISYLEAYLQVLTELGAATQFAVQTLINKAVKLIGAIAAVVFVVTEQRLVDTVSVFAGIRRVITFLLCSMKTANHRESKRQYYSRAPGR